MHVPDPRIGTVLHDRYLVLERVTEGSMGVVYRGERVGLKRPVAIKFLSESYATTADGVRRFEVEARAMSRLAHPNCVAVTDYGLDHGAPYLVMDYVTGRTLRQVVRDDGRLPPARAIGIVRQVLAGLTHAHAQGIIHRDVKPENILLAPVVGHGEQVRLVDFGLAKLRDERSITTGVAVGTPGYMAPEQTIGERVDERADVYATGIILFELLTGQKPFTAKSPFDVMRMHREIAPPSLEEALPEVPMSPRLNAVVQRALAKSREDRFPSAEAFLAAFEHVPEAHGRRADRSRKRPPVAVLAGIAAAAALVVGGGAWLVTRKGSPPPPAAAAPSPAEPTAVGAPIAVEAAQPPAEVKAPADAAPPTPPTPEVAPTPTPTPTPARPTAARTATSSTVPSSGAEGDDVARYRAQARGGDVVGALRGLEALRKKSPKRAAVHYALGNLYADENLWRSAVDAYANAMDLDPRYRGDSRAIADLVEALGVDKAHRRAAKVLVDEVGAKAIPRLDQAIRSGPSKVRSRAKAVRQQLAQK